MNNNIKAPCRYDFVGSFLRPDYLKKARADFENGAITVQQLKEVEDKAILDLVAKQKKAGYTANHQYINHGSVEQSVGVAVFLLSQLLCDSFGNCRGNTIRGNQQNDRIIIIR